MDQKTSVAAVAAAKGIADSTSSGCCRWCAKQTAHRDQPVGVIDVELPDDDGGQDAEQ